MSKRSCGDCTKCCEGYLTGEALGHSFYRGKPCHFISIGKGCGVYAQRPKEPCQKYKCAWLSDEGIPEWMKPNEIGSIVDYREIEGISYISITDAGQPISPKVLTWFIHYALSKQLNLLWYIDGGINFIGSKDFLEIMNQQVKKDSPTDK